MALVQFARCVCEHGLLDHTDEDEYGLFFNEWGCKQENCGCREFVSDPKNMEVQEVFSAGPVMEVPESEIKVIGETIIGD